MKQPVVTQVTEGIEIRVESEYLSDRSDAKANRFLFAYHITIKNTGTEPAQLLNRHWKICNAWGLIEEVQGPGVVGYQPRLRAEQTFEYTSFCPLNTPFGTMNGTFEMVRDDGRIFKAEVPQFKLIEVTESVRS